MYSLSPSHWWAAWVGSVPEPTGIFPARVNGMVRHSGEQGSLQVPGEVGNRGLGPCLEIP